MATIRQLLDSKGREVWAIDPDESVFQAIERMANKRIGALIVMRDEKLVGIVSERDYARKVILKGRSSHATPVRDIMTSKVYCARSEQGVEECMRLMTQKRVRHLPVLDGDRVDGMISIGDLVKSIIAEQQFTIEQLENYIYG
jgi:CBS domain-containing protein